MPLPQPSEYIGNLGLSLGSREPRCYRFGVDGYGLKVWSLGVLGLWIKVQSLGSGASVLGFRVWALGDKLEHKLRMISAAFPFQYYW